MSRASRCLLRTHTPFGLRVTLDVSGHALYTVVVFHEQAVWAAPT
jgi:hypothetical protein